MDERRYSLKVRYTVCDSMIISVGCLAGPFGTGLISMESFKKHPEIDPHINLYFCVPGVMGEVPTN